MSFAKYPTYKDSGVAWLGEVPGHWEVKRLKHNLRLLTEKTDRRTNPVALENIESWSGRFVPTETEFQGEGVAFEPGDILFGKLRPYLAKALLASQAGEAVGDFHVMRPGTHILPRFAQYNMLNRSFIDIVDGSTFGSKMPRASWEFVAAMHLPTPPLPEQTTIATFLNRETAKIDALVAEQQKLITLLQEKRQAVISHAVTKGLNPSAPMKDSGVQWLGEVPGHWEVVPLASLTTLIQTGPFGSQLHAEEYVEDQTPVINPANIRDGILFPDSSCTITSVTLERLETHQLELGDIIVGRRGEMGRCAVVSPEAVGWICGTGCLNVRLQPERADPQFVGTYLRTRQIREWLSLESVGSTMDNLNARILAKTPVPRPPLGEQTSIASFLDSELAQFDTLMTEARTAITLLQERRTALISAAVTGQIDVRAQAA